MNTQVTSVATTERAAFGRATLARAADYCELMKPRVMSLVVFTAMVGLLTAPDPVAPAIGVLTIVCIALGAGAAGALNMWYDADIDAVMSRTASRPIPQGRLRRGEALAFGLTFAVSSVMLLALLVGALAAVLLALTIAFYVLVYTAWLKRSTPYNIVIGGAAGAFAPVNAWVAATGGFSLEPLLLFLIIFLWTPPHFWALSLYRADDYARAGIPMLPVVAGKARTRQQILVYTLLLVIVSIVPWAAGFVGVLYGAFAILLGGKLAMPPWRLQVAGDDGEPLARRLFAFSIVYLFALFAVFLADKQLSAPAMIWSVATVVS